MHAQMIKRKKRGVYLSIGNPAPTLGYQQRLMSFLIRSDIRK